MDQLIITLAPGAPQAQLAAYPDLPRGPEQIAEEVVRAWESGAGSYCVWCNLAFSYTINSLETSVRIAPLP